MSGASKRSTNRKIDLVTRQYKRALDEGREDDARRLDKRLHRLMLELKLGGLR